MLLMRELHLVLFVDNRQKVGVALVAEQDGKFASAGVHFSPTNYRPFGEYELDELKEFYDAIQNLLRMSLHALAPTEFTWDSPERLLEEQLKSVEGEPERAKNLN